METKRLLLTILLCMAVLTVWQLLVWSPQEKRRKEQMAEEMRRRSEEKAQAQAQAGPPPVRQQTGAVQVVQAGPPPPAVEQSIKEEETVIETDLFTAVFTNKGASLKSLKLRRYKQTVAKGSPDAELVEPPLSGRLPLEIDFSDSSISIPAGRFYTVASKEGAGITYRYDGGGFTVEKSFSAGRDSYLFNMVVSVANVSPAAIKEKMVVYIGGRLDEALALKSGGMFSMPPDLPSAGCFANGSMRTSGYRDLNEEKRFEGDVGWAGLTTRYFLSALVATGSRQSQCRMWRQEGGGIFGSLMYPAADVAPGQKAVHEVGLYFGPKLVKRLDEAGYGLSKSVDYWIVGFLAKPMLWFLNFSFSMIRNYGIAIILLTIVVRVLMWPLNQKSIKSMEQMKRLKPLMDELKAKYGKDKERFNQEMANLYKKHGINPLSGCFPMLLQLPIWIALYRMLYASVELYHSAFISGWLDDLAAKDPFFILPILLGVTMFVQQKITPSTMEGTQAKMMLYFMPAFFTLMMLFLPSGLSLYIFVNSIIGIGQQFYMNRRPAEAAPIERKK